MTPEMFFLSLIAGGILVAQLLCLKHYAALVGLFKANEPHFTDITTNFSDVGEGINESLMEMIRIGSDVADQLDTISLGAGVVSSPTLSPKVDLQTTIMNLIADKFLASNHGGTTQQERTILEEDSTTTPSESSE
jgi:hypothetical protein